MNLTTDDAVLEGTGGEPFVMMEALQDIQDKYRYLPEKALVRLSEDLAVPLIEVFRLANFYKAFSLEPRGRHLVTVCTGTACHVQGAPNLAGAVLGQLKVEPGQTTSDGAFTVETVNCLGACALAPVVVIDGKCYGHMTPGKLRRLLKKVWMQDEAAATDLPEVANA